MRGRVEEGNHSGRKSRSDGTSGGGERGQRNSVTRYTEKFGYIDRGSYFHENLRLGATASGTDRARY
ncbi:unnamed protein product [Ascophyllum nodosum]